MSVRGTITDMMGREIFKKDLVAYPSRQGNRVRQSIAVVERTYVVRIKGRLYPMVKCQPTGIDSGFTPRLAMRAVHVSTEHMVLVERGDD